MYKLALSTQIHEPEHTKTQQSILGNMLGSKKVLAIGVV